ncbi:MAG: hypothetical protein ACQGVK_12070 [Myxococcota bacterium]
MTPFDWVAPGSRRRLLVVLTVALAGLSVALTWLGAPLATPEAPRGILSFEFAGSNANAARMVASWGPEARAAAHTTLGLDYLYLLVYPAWFSLACVRLAARRRGALARLGLWAAWAVWAASPLDAVENAALLGLLGEAPADGLAALAFACAAPKFAVVGAAALYLIVGLVARGAGPDGDP